ncbi:bifunctional aminoglycoside phosphotransferase/ATP-binding protein [Williamsia sp. SKLECPSW1]
MNSSLQAPAPETIPAAPSPLTWTAQVRETHSGCVILLGDTAYKLKKPVDMGFLDFTTARRRHAALHREWELNARFAPDAYVGIAYLADAADGTPEPLLQMRRQSDDDRLSTLARSGADLRSQMRSIARIVTRVHRTTPAPADPGATGSAEALRARWRRNIATARACRPGVIDRETIDRVAALADTYVTGRSALFDSRVAAGMIVDGHGDLIADDIFCHGDDVTILDCLDFDDSLRHVDALDDACFLAMDLEHHGRTDLAAEFLRAHEEETGDAPPTSLRHHFIAYRAFVRAEVASIRSAQGDVTAAADARAYTAQAVDHLRAGQVRLVIVGGLPGTGKSTVAQGIADALHCTLLSSDVVRKQLAGLDPLHSARAAFSTGLYTPEMTERTYDVMFRRAHIGLDLGRSVVMDATWRDEDERIRARHLAHETGALLVELECVAPESMSRARLATRAATASDADTDVHAAMARTWPRWHSATPIDTSGLPGSAVRAAVDVIEHRLHPATEAPDTQEVRR